jgi:AcrR family transcriptional regulator
VLYNIVSRGAVNRLCCETVARPKIHDDALRGSLIDITSRLIAERGADSVGLREAARSAGTSTSAVYALFGGREELLAAIATEAVRRFADHLARVPDTDEPAADLRALGRAYRDSALTDPRFYRVMFDPGRGRLTQAATALPDTFAVLERAAQRCIDAGLCATSDARAMAITLWALVHGLVQLELAGLVPGDAAARGEHYDRALASSWSGFARR